MSPPVLGPTRARDLEAQWHVMGCIGGPLPVTPPPPPSLWSAGTRTLNAAFPGVAAVTGPALPLTGATSAYGVRLRAGLQMALDEANANGGVQPGPSRRLGSIRG